MSENKENKQNSSKFGGIDALKNIRRSFLQEIDNLKKTKQNLMGQINKVDNLLSSMASQEEIEEPVIEKVEQKVEVETPVQKNVFTSLNKQNKPNNTYNRNNSFNQSRPKNNDRPNNFGKNNFQSRQTYNNRQQDGQKQGGFNRQGYQNGGNTDFKKFQKPFNQKPMLEALPEALKTRVYNNNNKKRYEEHEEKRVLNKRQKLKIFGYDDESDERMGSRKLKVKKVKEPIKIVNIDSAVLTQENVTVKELSEKISKPVSEILKKLIELGMMLTINSTINFDTAELVSGELGVTLTKKIEQTIEEKIKEEHKNDNSENQIKRPPVVAVLGHVDHGKTSLLDAIRKSDIAGHESGGITQHIGAYSILTPNGKITFIDTPGHAAFTQIRARGAKATDIAILVVAADDGVKPQTIEAIKLIKDAEVPMIVAINKMDVAGANVERVKQQLSEQNVLPEDWGGDAIIVPISAKTGLNVDKLLDTIILVADMCDLKANPNKHASGTVLEARLDKSQGAVATLLVQNGTLKVGDTVVAGTAVGKVRSILDEKGSMLKEVPPSMPAFVVGLDEVPHAGDFFYVVDANLSRKLIEERKNKIKEQRIQKVNLSADDFLARVDESKMNILKIVLKTDVQGSVDALKYTLEALSNDEVKVSCISASVGLINENDIVMAKTSGAILIAFNIKSDAKTLQIAKKYGVEIKNFKIIYEAEDFVKNEVKKLKEPKFEEEVLGRAEVRLVFKLSSVGLVAGCMVKDGKIRRNAKIRVIRKGEVIATDDIDNLKIQKDDQREVAEGYECGVKLSKFNDYKEGDILECYILNEIKD